jgi:hypothetical protein
MNLLTVTILVLGILAAFWSGFYVGYIKREGKKPPVPFVTDINEFAEEIMDKVRDKMAKEKETEPDSFYN